MLGLNGWLLIWSLVVAAVIFAVLGYWWLAAAAAAGVVATFIWFPPDLSGIRQ